MNEVVGVIGGMSWYSTAAYYRLLNEGVAARLGPDSGARALIYSLDNAEACACLRRGDTAGLARLLVGAGRALEAAGAACVLVACNSAHVCAAELRGALRVPLLDIRDAVSRDCRRRGFSRVGLLGTQFTVAGGLYADLTGADDQGAPLVPAKHDREWLHRVIYEELCRGVLSPATSARCVALAEQLQARGAEAVVLGCTELSLLSWPAASVPVVDSAAAHCRAAVDFVHAPTS